MRDFIQKYRMLTTFILFLTFFSLIMIIKPPFVFNRDGSFKDFGLGYTNRSVLPIWVISIVFAIMAYYIILFI